jgi:Reverse transcriptase (RNA-dependent DNA polymerase)
MITLAVTHNWELHQMDIKSAYLNGDLEETIFHLDMHLLVQLAKFASSRKVSMGSNRLDISGTKNCLTVLTG